jgi:hypothetical protein
MHTLSLSVHTLVESVTTTAPEHPVWLHGESHRRPVPEIQTSALCQVWLQCRAGRLCRDRIPRRPLPSPNHNMSSLSKEEKEKKALALRAEALRHLSSAGQMVAKVGTQTVQKTETGKRGDNTLELLLRESAAKAELRQIRLKAMSATESIAKATSVEQQEQPQPGTTESTPLAATPTEAPTEAQPLPAGWQKIPDPASGRCYYWNILSNETTWEVPSGPAVQKAAEVPSLPQGWVQKLHPATKQSYYVNAELGLSSFTIPVGNAKAGDAKSVLGSRAGSAVDAGPAKRQRP